MQPLKPSAWHALPVADAFQVVQSGEQGLAATDAAARLQRNGPNTIVGGKGTSR